MSTQSATSDIFAIFLSGGGAGISPAEHLCHSSFSKGFFSGENGYKISQSDLTFHKNSSIWAPGGAIEHNLQRESAHFGFEHFPFKHLKLIIFEPGVYHWELKEHKILEFWVVRFSS